MAQVTRFLPPEVVTLFDEVSLKAPGEGDAAAALPAGMVKDIRGKIAGMWD